jgi:glycosyltransferase involved in cell wall biosynthesis
LRWPEIDRLLADAPVFISTALVSDPGGLLLRAAAHGCPLILSDVPAHRESWRGAAVFVNPGDHQGFAAAMRRAREDDEHRAAMAEAARRRVRLLGAMRRSETLHEVLTSLSGSMRLTAAE